MCLNSENASSYTFYHQHSADNALTLSDIPQFSESIKAIHFSPYALVVSPTAETLFTVAKNLAKPDWLR